MIRFFEIFVRSGPWRGRTIRLMIVPPTAAELGWK